MALVHGWYGNGLSDAAFTSSSAGRGDDTFSAVNGGADVQVTSGGITMVESGSGARNFRKDISPAAAEWATQFGYTHRAVSAGVAIVQVLDNGTPTQIARLEVNSSGTFTLRNSANGTIQASAGGTAVAGTEYCIKVYADGTTVTCKIYPVAGGSPVATLTGAHGSANPAGRFVYGGVTSVTATGNRRFDAIEIHDTDDEPPFLTESTYPVRVTANPGAYTASSGTITDALADASDSSYAQSSANPGGSVLTMQMQRLSREDVVSVVVRDDNSEAGSVSRLVEILYGDGTTVLGDATYTISSTTSANHTVVTDDPLAAGEVFYVRLTDTAV